MKTMASTPFKTIAILGKVLDETGYKFVIEDTFIDFDGKQFTIRGSSQPSQPTQEYCTKAQCYKADRGGRCGMEHWQYCDMKGNPIGKPIKVIKSQPSQPQTQDCNHTLHSDGTITCDYHLSPSQPQTSEGSWEADWMRFRKEKLSIHSTLWNYPKAETVEMIKQFISDLLARERRNVVERIREFEERVNVFDMSKDGIDDDNSMLGALIGDSKKLIDDLTREESKNDE